MRKYLIFSLVFLLSIFFVTPVNANIDGENKLLAEYNLNNNLVSLTWDCDSTDENIEYKIYTNDTFKKQTIECNATIDVEKNNFYNIKLERINKNDDSILETISHKLYTGEVNVLSLTIIDSNRIKIEYNKINNAFGYYIYRAINNDEYKVLKKVTGNDVNDYVDSGLKNKTIYKYKVIPFFIDNNSEFLGVTSKEVQKEIHITEIKKVNSKTKHPGKVKNLSIVQTHYNKVKICWNKENNITGYKVYMATRKKGKYRKIQTINNNCTFVEKLSFNKTYYFKVRAYSNINGKNYHGAYSNLKSKKIKLMIPDVNVHVRQNNNLMIEYKKVPYAKKYYIYRSNKQNGTYKLIKKTSSLSYKDKRLKTNTTYYYKVRAFTKLGKTKLYSKNSKVAYETTTERNAKRKINLVSSYNDTEAYHPDILHFKNSWHGYKYWLVFTPYPNLKGSNINGDSKKENPHVRASNDLKNWVIPSKQANPLDEPTQEQLQQGWYNSDAELVYNNTLNRIECFWRTYTNNSIIMYMSYTSDGINWSVKQKALELNGHNNMLLSPSIVYENGIYKMWYVNSYKINFEEFDTLPFNSSINKKVINIPNKGRTIYPWHLDVIKNNNKYEMIFVGTDKMDYIRHMSLYYSNSNDNVSWSTSKKILGPSIEKNAWDNRGIYRSSFFYENGRYYVLYSASNRNNIKGTSIVYGKNITDVYPFN